MVHFPILRTRRFTLTLRELTIGQSISLASLPSHLEQAEVTQFLKFVVENVDGVDKNPASWTVQERTLALCHYLAATSSDGPDFSVGDGKFSDYFDGTKDHGESRADIGVVGGDKWFVTDLTGRDAETIERLDGELEGITGRIHWILGAMAAQLRREGEDKNESMTDGDYEKFVLDRMKVFSSFPESDFMSLMALFFTGLDRLMHFFDIDFSDSGIVFLPTEAAEVKNLPPARFPVGACISQGAFRLVGKSF